MSLAEYNWRFYLNLKLPKISKTMSYTKFIQVLEPEPLNSGNPYIIYCVKYHIHMYKTKLFHSLTVTHVKNHMNDLFSDSK